MKASICKFLSKCFKYSNTEEYFNEYNKISEKVEEINTINVSHILLNKQFLSQQMNDIKIINLYNCKLKEIDDDLQSFLNSAEEINLSNNYFTSFSFNNLNPNVKSIDISNNFVKELKIKSENIHNLEHLDISFNYLDDLNLPLIIITSCEKLKTFNLLCNPFNQKFFNELNCDGLNNIDANVAFEIKYIIEKINSQTNLNKENSEIVLSQYNRKNLKTSLKRFDILYYNYSFTNKYINYSNVDIFQEKCTYIIYNAK